MKIFWGESLASCSIFIRICTRWQGILFLEGFPSSLRTASKSKTGMFLESDSSFPSTNSIAAWTIAVTAVASILLLLGFCFLLFLRTRKDKQEQADLVTLPAIESTFFRTLVNTNIGISGHLPLEQDSCNFAKGKLLTSGGQAEVYVVHVMDEKLVKECGSKEAVQKIFLKAKEIMLHEVSILSLLKKYPYFASIVAYTLEPLSIIMKYYPEGSLDEWIKENQLSLRLKTRFSFEIASALRTMHGHELAHCDIKTQNILIEVIGREPHCCLSDFGIKSCLNLS